MANFSNPSLFPVEDGSYYDYVYNDTWPSSNNYSGRPNQGFSVNVVFVFTSSICIVGLVGNGIVICLLGFHIKKSPFTTYILNLAAADFGLLLWGSLISISLLTHTANEVLLIIAFIAAPCMYGADQLILTAISIDRCVSVLFPIWYRCHRPRHLSTIACAIIWVLAWLPSGSFAIIFISPEHGINFFFCQFIAGAVVCLPLVTVSTMILFFKMFCKSQQPRRGRILTIILLTLLFFLIFAFPLNAIVTVNYFNHAKYFSLLFFGFSCACLNSCVNPVIYYMVGRKKRGQERQDLKVIFQRAFKEEEEQREEGGTAAQTQL